MDQSDAGSAGIFSQWTNQMREARVYSHSGPIRCRKRGYILTADQSDTGSVGIFSEALKTEAVRRQPLGAYPTHPPSPILDT
eukprot:3964675-Pyramimonas_sp.AAC.2